MCGKTYYEESRVYVGKSHMCFTHLQMYICVGNGATHEWPRKKGMHGTMGMNGAERNVCVRQ